jgi:hypothetical protein
MTDPFPHRQPSDFHSVRAAQVSILVRSATFGCVFDATVTKKRILDRSDSIGTGYLTEFGFAAGTQLFLHFSQPE